MPHTCEHAARTRTHVQILDRCAGQKGNILEAADACESDLELAEKLREILLAEAGNKFNPDLIRSRSCHCQNIWWDHGAADSVSPSSSRPPPSPPLLFPGCCFVLLCRRQTKTLRFGNDVGHNSTKARHRSALLPPKIFTQHDFDTADTANAMHRKSVD